MTVLLLCTTTGQAGLEEALQTGSHALEVLEMLPHLPRQAELEQQAAHAHVCCCGCCQRGSG